MTDKELVEAVRLTDEEIDREANKVDASQYATSTEYWESMLRAVSDAATRKALTSHCFATSAASWGI